MAATLSSPESTQDRLGVMRCALTGAVVFGGLFALCWVGAAFNVLGASHMYIGMFTVAPVASLGVLAAGLICSVVIGGLIGAFIAVTYNTFGFVSRG